MLINRLELLMEDDCKMRRGAARNAVLYMAIEGEYFEVAEFEAIK